MHNVFKLPRETLDASLTGSQSEGLAVSSLALKATGNQQELQFQGDAKGRVPSPFEIQWRGRGLLSEGSRRLYLETFKGKAEHYPFALIQPLTLHRTGTGFSLEQLAMTFGKGNLTVSGRLGPGNAQLNATFRASSGGSDPRGRPPHDGSGCGRNQGERLPGSPAG